MIGFNGTYLPDASHGNMRITAASIGGQWVMAPWFTHATQQAIIAAFGAEEGKAVITKTNDYLNAIAATDPTRAQQIADFINEDPLLVCSLVETSKVRGLVGDGKAYILTGFRPTLNAKVDIKLAWIASSGNNWDKPFGTFRPMYILQENNDAQKGYSCSIGANSDPYRGFLGRSGYLYTDHEYHQIHTENGLISQDGNAVTFTKYPTNLAADQQFALFGTTNNSGVVETPQIALVKVAEFKAEDNGERIWFLPYNNGTECGMLDIISGTFYPNANTEGAFTIAITDKTPA